MTFKQYFLHDSACNMSEAVKSIMILFGMVESDHSIKEESVLNTLPQSAVFVQNTSEKYNGVLSVVTKIYFWHNGHSIDSLSYKSSDNITAENVTQTYKRLCKLNVLYIMRSITGLNPSPWGILRGVRPTKITHRLIDQGLNKQLICEILTNDYAVNITKAELVADIAFHQRHFLPHHNSSKTISLYIGIPFCPSRCLYCSFPSYVLPEQELVDKFLSALQQDIEAVYALINKHQLIVQNIYLGGGTPTSLSNKDFYQLLELIKNRFYGSYTKEFTVEAGRPDSINNDKISAMCSHNVTRVSVNPQSMQQKTLNRIGRTHTVQDIINVFGKIRQSGIPVVNMDVIIGLPGETQKDVVDTMKQITALQPDNLTLHTLSLKKGSVLKTSLTSNQEDLLINTQSVQSMSEVVDEYAREMGMQPYYLYRQKYMMGNLENIGYARPGKECNYNIQIMEERQTIIGIGPAAGTKAVNVNTWSLQSCYNAKDLQSYISNLDVYLGARDNLLTELLAKDGEE